ncbi:hypothetical protein ACFVZA_10415 [Streptomyces bottropensis]|uniref:hypothetical protein n=1 Tax=Streptomyces bottropensis TaxID=42235 RepID=UPI00367D8FED
MGEAVDPRQFFATQLKALLMASGLTQSKAAELATKEPAPPGSKRVRITNGQISAWVRRVNLPSWTALAPLVRVLINRARQIDARLVAEGQPPRSLPEGLLNEQSWPRWLRAAQGPRAPVGVPRVRDCDPIDLGVHRAAAHDTPASVPAADPGRNQLTPYLVREHDRRLRQALAATASGGPSVFALLVGNSTTGKTRALYEAIVDQMPDHTLLHPADADDLQHLLAADAVTPGTVLWLNETQRYLQGEAGDALAKQLVRCLTHQVGISVVGSMWRTPYFADLTAQGRRLDSGTIRDLLTGGRTLLIDIPDSLRPDECDELRALASRPSSGFADTRVISALNAATRDDGRVIQHLSGGPELLTAYRNKTLFTPVEHALITAALDARRLGHNQPIPKALLADAADGYLSSRQRSSKTDWASTALDDLTCGYRSNNPEDRTDIRNTLTALAVHVVRSGTPPAYEPADYLDQHIRFDRQDQLGPAALWDALTTHAADPADLVSLAQAAESRELLKTAARLYSKAVLGRSLPAVQGLIQLLKNHDLDPDHHGARWLAAHADVTAPDVVTGLLRVLRQRGASGAAQQLISRAVPRTDPTNPESITDLLSEMREAGAGDAARHLAARAATDARLTNPTEVGALLWQMRELGVTGAIQQLCARAATQTDPCRPGAVAYLLSEMKEAGAADAARHLAARAATDAELTDALGVADLLSRLRTMGATGAVVALVDRHPADHARLPAPNNTTDRLRAENGVLRLLSELKAAGDEHAARQLYARAVHAALTRRRFSDIESGVTRLLCDLWVWREHHLALQLPSVQSAPAHLTDAVVVTRLLTELTQEGPEEALQELAARAAHADLTDPVVTLQLVTELMQVRADEQTRQLLAQAAHADLIDPVVVAGLLEELVKAGANKKARQLCARAARADQTELTRPEHAASLLWTMRRAEAWEEVQTLSARAADRADPTDPALVADLLAALRSAGTDESLQKLSARVAANADLTNPYGVARLVRELKAAGAKKDAHRLSARAVTQTSLANAEAVAYLLDKLRWRGEEKAARLLSARAAAHADLTSAHGVGYLLAELKEAGAEEAVQALLARHPTAHVALSSRDGISTLTWALRMVGAEEIESLLRRAMDAGVGPEDAFPQHGRQTDGQPAPPWTWSDLRIPG